MYSVVMIMTKMISHQQMGILLAFRGNPNTPPFAAVAVDFFGPLQTKVNRNTTTESTVKIVTYTTTRVIHLELTSTASTESFLLACRRFVTRRDIHPAKVFSDRGKNFQGAQQPLRDWIDSWNVTKIKWKLAANRTNFQFDWEFNVPKASHMNGVVKSLIRSWRRGLDTAINYLNRHLTFEEWQTFLSEMMYLINSRRTCLRRITCNHQKRLVASLWPANGSTTWCRGPPKSTRHGESSAATHPHVLGDVVAIYATASDLKVKMVSSVAEPTSRRLSVVAAFRPKGKCCTARNVGTYCGYRCASWRRLILIVCNVIVFLNHNRIYFSTIMAILCAWRSDNNIKRLKV